MKTGDLLPLFVKTFGKTIPKVRKYRIGSAIVFNGTWPYGDSAKVIPLAYARDFEKMYVYISIGKKAFLDTLRPYELFKEKKILVGKKFTGMPTVLKEAEDVDFKVLQKVVTMLQSVEPFTGVVVSQKIKQQMSSLFEEDDQWTEDELVNAIEMANRKYRKGESSGLTDEEYDDLREKLAAINPKNPILQTSGPSLSPAEKKAKVKLPYTMGSMTKQKDGSGTINKFKERIRDKEGLAVISGKMDGISCMLIYDDGTLKEAYTSSDGVQGQNILSHTSSIPTIPATIPTKASRVVIRGELEMSNKVFQKKYTREVLGEDGFSNPRNLVSGLLNRKDVDKKILKDIGFHGFEIKVPDDLPKRKQFARMQRYGFLVAPYKVVRIDNISDNNLRKVFSDFKAESDHAMDGAIVEVNSADTRKGLGFESNGLNPKYATAWKTATESKDFIVTMIEPSVGKTGKVVPRIHLKPQELSGVIIEHVTAHNYKYILENRIGKGTVLEIVRSGDVIPYIKSVVKPTAPDVPSELPNGTQLVWDANGTHLVVTNAGKNSDVRKGKMLYFVRTLGIDDVADSFVDKVYEAGYNNLTKLIRITKDELSSLGGVGTMSAGKFVDRMKAALTNIPLHRLQAASGFFPDMGEKRLALINEFYKGDTLNWDGLSDSEIVFSITSIPGFQETLAKKYADNIHKFIKWYEKNSDIITLEKWAEKTLASNALEDQTFVFSNVRDAQLEQVIVDNGGKVSGSVSKKTTALIWEGDETGKSTKAKEFGVTIYTMDEFKNFLRKNSLYHA